jgi:hypothetical protein
MSYFGQDDESMRLLEPLHALTDAGDRWGRTLLESRLQLEGMKQRTGDFACFSDARNDPIGLQGVSEAHGDDMIPADTS